MAVTMAPLSFWLALLLGGGGLGLPVGMPPLPEDPVIARVAPEECLWYVSWAGTAQPNPASKNQTEQLLAEEEVRQLVSRLDAALTTTLQRGASRNPEQAILAAEVPRLVKGLLSRPAAIFVSKVAVQPGIPDVRGGLIVNTGERAAEFKESLGKLETLLVAQLGGMPVQEVTVAGSPWRRLPLPPNLPQVLWGFKGAYLVVAVGQGSAESIVARGKGQPAAWMAKLRKDLPVDRVSTVGYLNVKGILTAAAPVVVAGRAGAVIDSLGLGNVQSIATVTGLDATGCVNKTLIVLDGEPAGVLAPLAAKPLTAADLAVIPQDATLAIVARVDLEKQYRQVLDILGKIEPRAQQEIGRELARMETELGFRLSEDLLQPMGDVWRVYNSPGEGGLVITGLTAVVSVRDRAKLEKTLTQLRNLVQQHADQLGGQSSNVAIASFKFRGQEVCFLNVAGEVFPVAPAWCLTDKELIVATYPQMIKAYLSREAGAKTLADVPAVANLLKTGQNPVMLSYQDTKAVFRLAYPAVQVLAQLACSQMQRHGINVDISLLPSAATIERHLLPATSVVSRTSSGILIENHQSLPGGGGVAALAPLAVGLALPAVASARDAARRNQSANNLKQIGLAMHIYHDALKRFPAAAILDKQGKPLLSWRVQILPYIEQQALYQQFHLNEPWDSAHNRALIAQMPAVYASPDTRSPQPGKTRYLVPVGEGGMFADPKGPQLMDITDGTSNTIMVVEVGEAQAVEWTKPDDLKVDPKQPLAGLAGSPRRGFLAALADGSVHFLSESIDPAILRALFTAKGGEAVGEY
ncbi:MAG: DUF1559 family PulG-like putative transporter [Pirellulales bacterium]